MESSHSSLASTPTPSPLASVVLSSLLSNPPEEIVWERATWLHIEAPQGGGRQASGIWQHGHQYLKQEDLSQLLWRCGRCSHYCIRIGVKGGRTSTGNPMRHLLRKHHINAKAAAAFGAGTVEEEEEEDSPYPQGFKMLYNTLNFEDFRFYLIRWIVERHIPFNVVEDRNFQLMLKSLNERIEDRVVKNGDSVHDWIEHEFIKSKRLIIDVLSKSRSKIHVSCDLWSSPNGYAVCGIAAHFVGHEGSIQSVLLGMKQMMAAHGGEQIASHIISVIKSFGIAQKLGTFIADNVETNDTAWRAVLAELHPERNPEASRSRCIAHIINLAAKDFIFGKNTAAFEAATELVNDLTPIDSKVMKDAQDAWRRFGALGKLHNIIRFIRASPQRREAFKASVVGDSDIDSKYTSNLAEQIEIPEDDKAGF